MPANDGENRKIPGDRLVSRIFTRVRRRPRIGFSPDFYARFGMADPWVAPEFGNEEPTTQDGMVFLSAQPYYSMMRRLAAARRRRERRETAFQARHPGGAAIRAVARHWPGETAASLAVSRLARLALEEMTLPPPIAAVAAAPTVNPSAFGAAAPSNAPVRRAGSDRTSRGAKAWWSTPFVPARVFGGSASAEDQLASDRAGAAGTPKGSQQVAPARPAARRVSPADHAGARLADAAARGGVAARAIAEAVPGSLAGRQLARVVEAIEALPLDEQQVQIRRVVRRLGASAPMVRTVFEEGEASLAAGAPAQRPSQIAARRADPASAAGSKAGLRTVLSRSPAMALASAPEVDRAASGTLATAERSVAASGTSASLARLPRRAAATQRALARGAGLPAAGLSSVPAPVAYARAATTASLSASPVQRPAASSPAGPGPRARLLPEDAAPRGNVVAAARRDGAAAGPRTAVVRPGLDSTLLIGSDPTAPSPTASSAPAASVRMPASARAVSRYRESALPAPLPGAASEAANAAVRTTQGTWVAARSVLPSERDPAIRAHVRVAPASAHAASRIDAGQVEGASVLPRAIAAPDRVLAALPAASSVAASSVAAALSASPVAREARPASSSSRSVPPTGSMPVRTAKGAWVAARSPEGRVALSESGTQEERVSTPAPRGLGGAAGRLGARRLGESPAPVASARALTSSAFRTAEPAPAVSGGGAPAGAEVRRAAPAASWARPQEARPSGVVHAAGRAAAPPVQGPGRAEPVGSRAPVTPSSASSKGASSAPASASRASSVRAPSFLAFSGPASSAGSARGAGDDPTGASRYPAGASLLRAPPMAHASARTDLPVDGPTLQPKVSPAARSQREVAPARARNPRAASVAAAARIDGLPTTAITASRSAATSAASSAVAQGPSPSRFARSGPLSFALPPLSAVNASVTAAAPARGPAATGAADRSASRARVRPTRVFTTHDAAYSPSSAVTTPSGVWISARTAAATPGLRVLRTEGGRLVALAPAPVLGAPGGAKVGAQRAAATSGASFARPFAVPTDDGADALIAPPPPARSRASHWAAERQRVGEATAYRGAYRTPQAVDPSAPVYASPDGEREPARQTRTPARRDRPRRLAATAGEMSLPTPMAGVGPSDSARSRAPLDERLHGVAAGAPDGGSPSWAARSDGAPRVRSPGGLFEALARATSTEEIVRVIYARADGVRETPLAKEAPVVQVIEQIRQEVRREQAVVETATRASRLDAPSATTIRGSYVQPVKSTTRVNRGGVRGVNATARSMSAGSGDDRIMKLVKKLQGLIHLAESEGRLADARSQVRMAEDSAGARAEGQGPVGTSKEGGEKGQKQDIEALGREVLEVVTRELEFRRSRRVEDHDESNWW